MNPPPILGGQGRSAAELTADLRLVVHLARRTRRLPFEWWCGMAMGMAALVFLVRTVAALWRIW